MAADALAFLADQQIEDPIVFGHSMGGRVTLNVLLEVPDAARAAVLVDVGPELSPEGVKVVGDFVTHNIEFDDLEVFLDNVERYDPFRTREHIARTVKYNLLQRIDGRYVSKADHRRIPGSYRNLDVGDVTEVPCPVLLVRGAESHVLLADAAARFIEALPNGRMETVPNVGHNVHGGNTQGFLEAITPFLASLD
jgi:esterase